MFEPTLSIREPSFLLAICGRGEVHPIHVLCLLGILLAQVFTGCAAGPVPETASLNPYVRQEWKKDEEHGPTYYKRLADYQDLQRTAATLSPAEQERVAFQMAELLAQEPNALLRRQVVITLGRLTTPAVQAPLRQALGDANEDIRIAACQALSKQATAESAALLGEVVRNDESLDVRLAATQELGKYSGPQVVESLAVALNDSNPALQYIAVQSLQSATGHKYGNSVAGWREFVEGTVTQPPAGPSLAERARNWF